MSMAEGATPDLNKIIEEFNAEQQRLANIREFVKKMPWYCFLPFMRGGIEKKVKDAVESLEAKKSQLDEAFRQAGIDRETYEMTHASAAPQAERNNQNRTAAGGPAQKPG